MQFSSTILAAAIVASTLALPVTNSFIEQRDPGRKTDAAHAAAHLIDAASNFQQRDPANGRKTGGINAAANLISVVGNHLNKKEADPEADPQLGLLFKGIKTVAKIGKTVADAKSNHQNRDLETRDLETRDPEADPEADPKVNVGKVFKSALSWIIKTRDLETRDLETREADPEADPKVDVGKVFKSALSWII